MTLPKKRLRSRQQFHDALRQSFTTGRETYTHILIGAGFSRTAGIPLASEIAGILARFKNLKRLKSWGTLTYGEVIRSFFSNEFSTAEELDRLRTDPALAKADYEDAYKYLFSDDEIFPDKSVSRENFMGELISVSQDRHLGYNPESLYLAYLCDYARRQGRPKIDTILTTNFDDVLPISFFELNAPCRLLDKWGSIEKEDTITSYPRIVYLHGRYLHYDIANTEEEIRGRSDLIAKFLRTLPHSSKLIVVGYSGWEDEVMNGLKTILQDREHKRLAAGIHWCLRGSAETASKQLLELVKESDELTVTTDISALEAMRLLLDAAGCTETGVLQHIRDTYDKKRNSLERTLIEVNEKDLGYTGEAELIGQEVEIVEPPSVDQATLEAHEAMRRASSLSIAFAMMGAVLKRRPNMSQEQEAQLYRARAALRLRYKIDIEGAISDYQSSLKLDGKDKFTPMIGMADAYASLGKYNRAKHFLGIARKNLDEGSNNRSALCDIIEANIVYQSDDIERAEQLLEKARATVRDLPEDDLTIRATVALILIFIYNAEKDKALSLIHELRKHYKAEIKGQYWDGVLLLAEGHIHLQNDSPGKAKKSLKSAQELIEKGPNFRTLGDIASHIADAFFRCNQWEEGEAAELAAIQYYGLAGIGYLQIRAAAWLEIYRAVKRKDFSPEWQKLAVSTLERYEKKSDLADSATYWAILGINCMANHFYRKAEPLARLSIQRSLDIFSAFERRMVQVGNGVSNQRHIAFVEQHVKLAELLMAFMYMPGVPQEKAREFINVRFSYEKFGFYSSGIEIIYSIVEAYLAKAGLASSEVTTSSGDDKSRLKELCTKKGYPYLVSLTRNL